MAVSVKSGVVVTGIKELDLMLKQMTPELNHRILGAANTAAAKPLIASAKSMVAKKSKRLEKSIGAVKISTRKATEIGTVHVGPRRGGGHKGYHGHLVELGTVERFHKSGKSTGVMPKLPFMRPSFERTQAQIISSQKELIAVKLVAFMKRKLGKAFIR